MLRSDPSKPRRKLSISKRRDSAVLSMPDLYNPTELQYTSPITKFQTFRVESNRGTGEEFYMKAIKNSRCVPLSLKHELEKLREMQHPNIVRVESVNISDYYSYVVFKKPKGEPLFSSKKKTYSERECRSILYQVARAMQYTHAYGNVHRDLRDSNIYVDYPKHNNYRPFVTLVDFGVTKTLQADQKLAILDDGSGFPSGHVRQAYGQFPAPEVLMDIRIDRNADSWFLGILIFRMICGKIPFQKEYNPNSYNSNNNNNNNSNSNSESENESDNFDILSNNMRDEEIRDAICSNSLSFDHENWVHISAPLDNLVRGLLHKDAKRRYTIDQIFWSKWIRKMKYDNIAKLITSHWLQKYKIEISANTMTMIEAYASFGLTSIQFPHISNSSMSKGILEQFKERKKLEKTRLSQLTFHNDYRSVIHQTKIYDLMNDSPFISSECFITISSNVWCSSLTNPMIFEFRLDYVKNDIFLGIITDEYKSSQSFMHHIGSDDQSIGISLRECIAYYNNQSKKSLKRNDYLNSNVKHSIYSQNSNLINNSINSNNVSNSNNIDSSINKSINNSNKNDSNNSNASMLKSTNPAAQVYNLQASRTSVIADNIGLSWLNKTSNNKMSGPPPIRYTIVRMRIDYMSHCLSLWVGDREVLDPLYFDFNTKVTAAFTMTHCLDQVTLRNVEMEISP